MRVAVSCSDLSGEHHAALLLDQLGSLLADHDEELVIFGLGSERLKEIGAELFADIAEWSAMGMVGNLLSVGKMLLAKKKTPAQLVDDFVKFILERKPDVVLLIDSRVLNLAVAAGVRKAGYGGIIVYHVAPVRWESAFDDGFFEAPANLKRFEEFGQLVDYFFLIYPVSLEAYRKLELPHEFIGHPMAEVAKPTLSREKFARLAGCKPELPVGKKWITLMPGSRWEEVKAIAPNLFAAARNLAQNYPDLHFTVPVAHQVFREFLQEQIIKQGIGENCSLLDSGSMGDIVSHSHLAIAKSGTVLHLATLARIPMIMVYDVAPVQRWVADKIIGFTFPFYAFPNIIARREVVPELVKDKFSPPTIAIEASHLVYNGDRRNKMRADLDEVCAEIVRPDPLGVAARKITELVKSRAEAGG
ncbi:MAG: hypothetical protein HRF49_06495 [bacterium]|jgi:lipid-A-disaccharide synthase